jgi:hypothetical protein
MERSGLRSIVCVYERHMATWLAIHKLKRKQRRHNFVTSLTLLGHVLEQFKRRFHVKMCFDVIIIGTRLIYFFLFLLQVSSTNLGLGTPLLQGRCHLRTSSLKATKSHGLKGFSLHRSLIRHAFMCFQPKQFKQSFLRGEESHHGEASFVHLQTLRHTSRYPIGDVCVFTGTIWAKSYVH